MTNETAVLDHVLAASSLFDLKESAGKKPKRIYLMYARQVHPDMFQDPTDKAKADKAFAHLQLLKEGDGAPAPSAGPARGPAAPQTSSNKIKTKRHEYALLDVFATNQVFTVYNATYDGGYEHALLSVLNSPLDRDLSDAHHEALKALRSVPGEYLKYFPTPLEFIRYKDESTRKEHAIMAVEKLKGFRPMTDILEVYPNGISGRDVAWMFRRMLVAVGNGNDIGLVNGAPTLEAFMVHPEMHGIILRDWQYSTKIGTPLKAVPTVYKDWYPESVFKKEPATHALDMSIVASAASSLLAEGEPSQLRAFFKGCKVPKLPKAPELLYEFDQLLFRLYGKRKFHEFTLDK